MHACGRKGRSGNGLVGIADHRDHVVLLLSGYPAALTAGTAARPENNVSLDLHDSGCNMDKGIKRCGLQPAGVDRWRVDC
jgi:hypothetical protein